MLTRAVPVALALALAVPPAAASGDTASPGAPRADLASPDTAPAAALPAAGARYILRCGTGIHSGEEKGLVWLPSGGVFCPLFADPKAIRTFASFLYGKFPKGTAGRRLAEGGVGDGIAFVRLGGRAAGDGLQFGLEGAVFTQFDLDAPSAAILNADYIVGLPLTYRSGSFSARARVYHQSSHLGDESLLRLGSALRRENLSFEAGELIASQDVGIVRVYAGGEYLLDRRPSTLETLLAHGGAELRVGGTRGARFVAAVDVKSSEQQGWRPGVSVRAGVELASWQNPGHPPTQLTSVVADYYEGPSPYGQFFLEATRYLGVALQFQL
jgi:hypothetical protein